MTTPTVSSLREAYDAHELTPHDVVDQTIERVVSSEPSLHAFITVDEDSARRQADALIARRNAGEAPGPLWGIPFSVKDTFETAGMRTTFGSRIYRDSVPEHDAELVRRVRAAGGILIGKTNTPEFAIHIRTLNDLVDETRNPWDPARSSGGSSGGAAASISAGVTPIAIGSDGGGSVRIPASLCGSVGLMPSRGAIPRSTSGIATRRFSSAGPLALDATDAALLFAAMQGPLERDGLSRGLYPTGMAHQERTVAPRLRWVGDNGLEGNDPRIIDAVFDAAKELAHAINSSLDCRGDSMDAPRFNDAFYTMMQADRYSTGGHDLLADSHSNALLTGYARHHFKRGADIPAHEYSRAIDVQLSALEHMEHLLRDVEVVATPTVGVPAPEILPGEPTVPEAARRNFVAFTFLMNFTGLPAVSVPTGLVDGRPVGLQLIGREGSERLLLDLARTYQERIFRLPASTFAQQHTSAIGGTR